MQNMLLGKMDKLVIHFVGNKNNDEGVRFSEETTGFDSTEEDFKQLINRNFKFDEIYNFHFVPTLELNPVYTFVSTVFASKDSFLEQSQNAARYLYDKSVHPKVKGGELYLIYFSDCVIDGVTQDVIGIFKSENKDTFLKLQPSKNGYDLHSEKGINLNKLDKGCLIFNAGKENGYSVAIVDNTNKSSEAVYWKDEFLGVKTVKNEFQQTNEFLGIAKQFVTKQITEEFEIDKPEQIELLNRSVEYFKKHESFDKEEFEEEVFVNETVIQSFRRFDSNYREENEIELKDTFDISPQAVKKQARVFKNVLKLDRNFDIHIHGNKDLIEKGVEPDGRKYYKIYYQEEK